VMTIAFLAAIRAIVAPSLLEPRRPRPTFPLRRVQDLWIQGARR
jgi:hypothetical protein